MEELEGLDIPENNHGGSHVNERQVGKLFVCLRVFIG
jgi:hypothetical protein